MANEELMEKKMTEDELEQVAGGRKVYVVDYLKNGKINAYSCDFRGDIKKLQTLAKGGKVSSIVAGASWRKHEGIKKQYIAGLIAKYKRQGYQIIVSYQR
jgi:hypothetical protein